LSQTKWAPRGGDELEHDVVARIGWPLVSRADNTAVALILNHASRPEFTRHCDTDHRPSWHDYYDGLFFRNGREVCPWGGLRRKRSCPCRDQRQHTARVDRWDIWAPHSRSALMSMDRFSSRRREKGAVAAVGPQQLGAERAKCRTSFKPERS
jgi:hypothetical protein